MKTEIFSTAINNRNRLSFLYGLKKVTIEPYYIARESSGRKVIYGKMFSSNEIKKFNYSRIANIKILGNKFSPVIPIIPKAV